MLIMFTAVAAKAQYSITPSYIINYNPYSSYTSYSVYTLPYTYYVVPNYNPVMASYINFYYIKRY